MNNEMYLIHGEDYIKHIEEKAILYSMLKQVACKVAKLPSNRGNKNLSVLAKKTEKIADKMFHSWGIPTSYLYTGDSDMLAVLMDNELITPEDAGYYPIDDEDDCDGECCCGDCDGCCAYDDENEDYDPIGDYLEDFGSLMTGFNELVRSIFGDNVSVHIIVD